MLLTPAVRHLPDHTYFVGVDTSANIEASTHILISGSISNIAFVFFLFFSPLTCKSVSYKWVPTILGVKAVSFVFVLICWCTCSQQESSGSGP
jgi:hypothetical protein